MGVADITGAYAAGLAVAGTPKGTYIQTKYNPLAVSYTHLLLKKSLSGALGKNLVDVVFSTQQVAVSVGGKQDRKSVV